MIHKLIVSFLAILIGWGAGFVYYIIYSLWFSPHNRITDMEAILVWTAVFVTISWLIFVVPLIALVPDSSKILTLPFTPLFGAICGLVAFLLLVGWWTGFWSHLLYLSYSVVVGAITGLFYASFLHRRRKDA